MSGDRLTSAELADHFLDMAVRASLLSSADMLEKHGATDEEIQAATDRLLISLTAWRATERPRLIGWVERGGETLQ